VCSGGGGGDSWRTARSGIAGNGGENAVLRSKSRVLSKACPDNATVKGVVVSDVVTIRVGRRDRIFQILDGGAVFCELGLARGIATGIACERDEARIRGVAVAGGSSGKVPDHFITIEITSIAANAGEKARNVSTEVSSVEAVWCCNH